MKLYNQKKRKQKHKSQYQKRYEKGVQDGIKRGTSFFLKKFEEFEATDGIGEATMLKLIDTVGREYFTEWLEKRGIDTDEHDGL